MKTWEMLKELTENPNKRFRLPSWDKDEFITGGGRDIVGHEGQMYVLGHNCIDDGWEEVPTEVTWQEAIEAWANGKDIKSVIYDEEIFYKHEDGHLEDQNGDAISLDELTEGKWYIL